MSPVVHQTDVRADPGERTGSGNGPQPPPGRPTGTVGVPGQGRRLPLGVLLLLAVGLAAGPLRAQSTSVAVFNFQMKSQTPDWLWLEKGLADRMITDFCTDRQLALLQRDAMEEVAEKMKFVPELMKDPKKFEALQLGSRYLISGVYDVNGDKLTITAQVVEAATGQEVARRTVTGRPAEALALMQNLNVQLMAWLTKRQPEEIRAELPAWTRRIPAAKALYEGVHLYDQGRYGEAWLSFRRAAKEDPDYVESRYWVGKMYYFLARYDQARESLESFIYTGGRHPRLGTAIKEYIHTYEMLEPQADRLLEMYQAFRDRYPSQGDRDSTAPRVPMGDGRVSLHRWLAERTAKLLLQAGRPQRPWRCCGRWTAGCSTRIRFCRRASGGWISCRPAG